MGRRSAHPPHVYKSDSESVRRRTRPPTATDAAMQSAPPTLQRSGVVLALNRYSAAVRDMEQTVLLPSLLRDASCDRSRDDLYRDYLTLKAIRNTVESGLVETDAAARRTPEPLTERHAEALFHFHLTGLWSVMKDLTHKTQTLTDKYKDIIGISH